MDVNQIKDLVKLLESSEVTEISIEEGDTKIVVRKGGAAPAAAPVAASVAAPAAAAAPAPAAPAEGARPASWRTVVAPMVGTMYRAGSPGAAAFVEVGDTVAEGQTLCILEAMKLMNEIAAEEAGVIREIPVENAQPVEYGTVLFYYEPVA